MRWSGCAHLSRHQLSLLQAEEETERRAYEEQVRDVKDESSIVIQRLAHRPKRQDPRDDMGEG